MKKLISRLAKVAGSVGAALALVLAPLAVPAADASVLPSAVTGITLSPSVLASGEQYTLTVNGLNVGEALLGTAPTTTPTHLKVPPSLKEAVSTVEHLYKVTRVKT